jgi:NADH-quinone oxidoreductase subunit L
MLIGAIANAGLPPFAGFFSKDSIIEAVHLAQVPGAGFAYSAPWRRSSSAACIPSA